MDNASLLERAVAVRARAYAPYSRYDVGSAILDENGQVHLGCNVENTALPQGSCAEANAIAAMVAAGGTRIVKIAVAGGSDRLEACMPCGGCRQRISEFADEATRIITNNDEGEVVTHTIADLLPAPTKPL